jgi:hypothetical protein
MKKIRKVNQAKRKKARKEAQERLSEQAALMMHHPEECCVCKTDFKRTKENVKTWQVTIREGRVRLTCSACWAALVEGLEKVQSGL